MSSVWVVSGLNRFANGLMVWGLGPVLWMQGMWVQRKVPRLPEPVGSRSGTSGLGPALRLLLVGDSSAAGVGVGHQDQALSGQLVAELASRFCISWRVEATTGATTASLLEQLRTLDFSCFDVAVTALGVNDVVRGVSVNQWLQEYGALRACMLGGGVSRVIVSGLPPVSQFPALPQPLRWVLGRRAQYFDRALCESVEADPRATYVPLDFQGNMDEIAVDGFHPGAPIYRKWAHRLTHEIE